MQTNFELSCRNHFGKHIYRVLIHMHLVHLNNVFGHFIFYEMKFYAYVFSPFMMCRILTQMKGTRVSQWTITIFCSHLIHLSIPKFHVYYASVVESATICCKVAFQLMRHPLNTNIYLVKDFLLPKSSA